MAETSPARRAPTTTLRRISETARSKRLGQGIRPEFFDLVNHAVMHTGHAVSTDRMAGHEVSGGDVTAWTLNDGTDVLLVVWFILLRNGNVVPTLITMQPEHYAALDHSSISAEWLAKAHDLAGEFLQAAGG
jgi:hypothetical protein